MSTPSNNPPSFRYPFEAQIAKLPKDVQEVHRNTFNALTDIYGAIQALNTKTEGVKSSVASITNNVSTSTETIIQQAINNIGFVNDQAGVTSYTTVPGDYGNEIQLNDSSAIAVTLSTLGSGMSIQLPWFAWINNLGTGSATLTPSTGTINGSSSLVVSGGSLALIWFDGTNFSAAVSSPGFINPMTTEGDMIYQGSGVPARLAVGTADQVLISNGTDPEFVDLSSIGVSQLLAGAGIALSPSGGQGIVTVTVIGASGSYTSGSNANGYWEKNPNGKIDQWINSVSLGAGDYTWTFPVAFTVLDSINVQGIAVYPSGDTGYITKVESSVTLTQVTFHQNNVTGMYADLRAVGY